MTAHCFSMVKEDQKNGQPPNKKTQGMVETWFNLNLHIVLHINGSNVGSSLGK
jgi:hypothetical protein